MIINNTGTFYVEGEYAQGDTILKAGDWELRANGSKNAFAYSPETFVRRNLLNWSEDFTTKNFYNAGGSPTQNFIESPFNGGVATRVEGGSRAFNNSHTRDTLQDDEPISMIALVRGSAGNRIQWRQSSGSFSSSAFFILDQDLDDWTWLLANGTQLTGDHQFIFRDPSSNGFIEVAAFHIQKGHVDSTNFYQRTTTHVPRPFAIKDELVTNGTFDTDIDGWSANDRGVLSIESGRLVFTDTWGGGTTGSMFYSISTMPGATYVLKYDYDPNNTSANRFLRVRNFTSTGTIIAESIEHTTAVTVQTLQFTAQSGMTVINPTAFFTNAGASFSVDNISVKLLEPAPLTLGNGKHKDFRYYPKALSTNEVEALTA